MSGFCAAAAPAPPPPVMLHLAEAISLSLTGEVSLFFLIYFFGSGILSKSCYVTH